MGGGDYLQIKIQWCTNKPAQWEQFDRKKGEWKQVKDESEAEDRFFLCETKEEKEWV